MEYCKALKEYGEHKGEICDLPCDESGFCEHHKKHRVASDPTKIMCRKFTAGCTREVPPELHAKGIKSCLYHYKLQTGTDGMLCLIEGCKNAGKEEGYCLRHYKHIKALKEAEATGMVLCSTPTCDTIIDPEEGFKRCEYCRKRNNTLNTAARLRLKAEKEAAEEAAEKAAEEAAKKIVKAARAAKKAAKAAKET